MSADIHRGLTKLEDHCSSIEEIARSKPEKKCKFSNRWGKYDIIRHNAQWLFTGKINMDDLGKCMSAKEKNGWQLRN